MTSPFLWRVLLPVLAVFLLPSSTPVSAQSKATVKIVEHIWGFDGRIVPGQFNPLSILLDNQTDEAVDTVVVLEHLQGLVAVSGGQYVQQVFIGPAARRWIQFYPYIGSSYQSEWRISLNGKSIGELTQGRSVFSRDFTETGGTVPEETAATPQVVILDDVRGFTPQPTTVKHMPENLFPPYVPVTFGLHTVFLDHVPDWEQPREQAFMSWLRNGGRLHILNDRRGEFPRFTGELGDLNQPLNRFSLGSGVVVRHSLQRDAVTKEMVDRLTILDVLKGEDEELEEKLAELKAKGQSFGQYIDSEPAVADEAVFRGMRELTLPEHAWWLIFLLSLVYIVCIYPGCYVLSKQNHLHFLTTYGAIVGLSLVFSGLFLVIGRRGYDESTTLVSVGLARAEDASNWNTLQWHSLFVTSGDDYVAGAENQQSVYSTA
ncbi:MAG: hypothetical protein KDA89_09715, partial [Planctomycetaceae bacterium]|nr:hypothetical protein [Planctomycetaceae bacterium]